LQQVGVIGVYGDSFGIIEFGLDHPILPDIAIEPGTCIGDQTRVIWNNAGRPLAV